VLMSLFPLFLKRQCQLKPGSRSGRELGWVVLVTTTIEKTYN
jgi:hypothetical protein